MYRQTRGLAGVGMRRLWYPCLDFRQPAEHFNWIFNGTKGRCLVSSRKEPESPARPKGAVSRRGFIGGVGIGGGVLGTGVLETEASAAAANVVGPGPVPITLTINGKPVKLSVQPRVTLIDALRNYLDMTGAKRTCDQGVCGSCTVIMGGKSVYACAVLAIDAQGKNIETIEGLATGANLHPVSRAFWDNDAQQCGYCTPGFIMAAKGFLDEHPNPTDEDVKRGLGGNLCRCGTYIGIRRAVLQAAQQTKGGARNG
jgi:xanthine dehydrogenase YagT iron-sulfur-binding subunit